MSTRTSCIESISSKDLKTNRASTAASGPHSLECVPRTVTSRYRDLMFCVVYEDEGGLRIIGEIQIQDYGLHSLKLKVSAPASCGPAVWPLALSFAFSLNLPPSHLPRVPPSPAPHPLSHTLALIIPFAASWQLTCRLQPQAAGSDSKALRSCKI